MKITWLYYITNIPPTSAHFIPSTTLFWVHITPITNRWRKIFCARTLQPPIHRNLHRKLPLKQTLPTLNKNYTCALHRPQALARVPISTMIWDGTMLDWAGHCPDSGPIYGSAIIPTPSGNYNFQWQIQPGNRRYRGCGDDLESKTSRLWICNYFRRPETWKPQETKPHSVDKIYTLAQSIVVKTFGRASETTFDRICSLLRELIAKNSWEVQSAM